MFSLIFCIFCASYMHMTHDLESLDGFDRRLLAVLQDDSSLTNAVLGERIGLSASQVSRRRQRLEEAGMVRGYRAVLDPASLGLDVIVFIHVSLAAHSGENARRFRELVRTTPAVLEAHAVSGEADYLLKVAAPTLQDLADMINGVLLAHDSVARVRSEIVLESLKVNGPLPLPKF